MLTFNLLVFRLCLVIFSVLWNGKGVVLACSCLGPISLETSFQDKQTTAVKVWIRDEIFPNGPLDEFGNGFRYFRAKILRPYQGCKLRRLDNIMISTGGNSAICGVELQSRTTYLLFGFLQEEEVTGYGSQRVLSVGLCQYQIPFRQLSARERTSLARRRYRNVCPPELCPNREDCGNVPPVAPPIVCPDGSTAGVVSIECIVANGRCQWDFTSRSCPSCTQDADCISSPLTFCSKGLCRSIGTCETTADCFNPSNRDGAEITCVTKRECNANTGTNMCDVTCCKEVVNCVVDPCDNIKEPYDTCISDYCGGCTAYAFDLAGNPVN